MFFFKKLLAQASNREPALQNQNAKPLHYSLVCVVFYYYNIYLVYTFLIILLGRPFIHDLHFDSRSAADGDYQSASPRAPTLFSSRTCYCSWTCSPPPAVACFAIARPGEDDRDAYQVNLQALSMADAAGPWPHKAPPRAPSHERDVREERLESRI